MIKASISLQDLRRKIYLKVKTDSAVTGGVWLGLGRKRCQFDRPHNPSDEVNRESVVREIRMLRLTRRGLETGHLGTAPVLDPTWGAAGKAAIQRVKVPPCQLPDSGM